MAKKVKYYTPGKNRHRRKHYWWRYLLVFILGQALVLPEFVLTLGTAASSIQVGTVFDMAGLNKDEYVGKEYQDDTFLTLVMELVAQPEKFTTYGGLASISPALDKVYADFIDKYTTEYGVPLDKDEFYALSFAEFPNYLKDKLMGVKLADLLNKLGVSVDTIPVLPQLLYRTPVARIAFTETEKTIPQGGSFQFEVTIYPSSASDKQLTFASSNEDVATVDENGVVTVKGTANVGDTAVITATSRDGEFTTTVTITVEAAPQDNSGSQSNIKRDGEKPNEGNPGDGKPTEGDPEGGENPGETTPEHEHHYVDGTCDVCGDVYKEARTIQEILDMVQGPDIMMNLIGGLKLSDIPGVGDSLPPGLANKGIMELMDFNSLKIGDLITGGSDNAILNALKDKTISELTGGDVFNSLTIGELMGISDYKKATGYDVEKTYYIYDEATKTYIEQTIADQAEYDSMSDKLYTYEKQTGILAALADCTLSSDSISGKINTLKISDVMPEDQIKGTMLESFADAKIMELGDSFGDVYLYKLFKTKTFVDAGTATGPNEEEVKIDEDGKSYYVPKGTQAIMAVLGNTRLEKTNYVNAKSYDAKETYYTKDGETYTLVTITSEEEFNQAGTLYVARNYLTIDSMTNGGGLNEVINKATISDILGEPDPDSLTYLFKDCTMNDIENKIHELKIGDILKDELKKTDCSPFLMAIKDYYLMTVPEGETGKTVSQGINDLTLSDIMGADSLYKYFEVKINSEDEFTNFNGGAGGQEGKLFMKSGDKYIEATSYTAETTYYKYDYSSPVLGLMAGKKLYGNDSILTVLDTLTIGQAMGVDSNSSPLLQKIATVKVVGGDIQGAFQTCTLGDILTIDDSSPAILKELANTSIGNIGDAFNEVSLVTIIGEDKVFDTHGELTGIWKLMFAPGVHSIKIENETEFSAALSEYTTIYSDLNKQNAVASFTASGTFYVEGTAKQVAKLTTINEMGDLIKNLSTTIMGKTLFELQEAGIIAQETQLNKNLNTTGFGPEIILGNLTIQGLIDFVSGTGK